MKRKWKITIWVVLAVVVGAAAYGTYVFKFKKYDVADEEVAEIVADPYEVELPDGSKLIIGEDGSVTTGSADASGVDGEEVDEEADGEAGSATGSNATAGVTPSKKPTKPADSTSTSTDKGTGGNKVPASTDKPTTKPTVAEVKAKYEGVFNQLEGQADSKLNALISKAKNEYTDKKANGEKISYGYFFNKYMGAANTLEANTDAVFYGVVQAVEAELVANGFSKTHAKSFVEHYETTKKARRDSLMKKVTGR